METEPIKVLTPMKKRNKKLPSIIDQLEPYDISQDLLHKQAQATYGQLLQYPNQRKKLAQTMRRKNAPISEANHIELGPQRKTVAMRCHVNIKGQQVIAVLDSGAAVSIITAKLMRKLGLRIDRDSKTIVVTANGAREKALGTIINVKITL